MRPAERRLVDLREYPESGWLHLPLCAQGESTELSGVGQRERANDGGAGEATGGLPARAAATLHAETLAGVPLEPDAEALEVSRLLRAGRMRIARGCVEREDQLFGTGEILSRRSRRLPVIGECAGDCAVVGGAVVTASELESPSLVLLERPGAVDILIPAALSQMDDARAGQFGVQRARILKQGMKTQ